MGVRGLLSYVLRHKERGTVQTVDLVEEAHRYRGRDAGLTLLVDLLDFAAWFLPQVDRLAKEVEPDGTFEVYGGEYAWHDEELSKLVFGLRSAGVYLEFFVDSPPGCGLVDSVSGNAWADEAKRRSVARLESAKSVRQWCRGEREALSEFEGRCQSALWFDQMRATLTRCGCGVWHLSAEEQAPLLPIGRGSDWGHVWGVVSDNIDWAVVRGVRLVPMSCFDLDGNARPSQDWQNGGGSTWPQVARLAVGYTSSDLLSEFLRLGHPPKEEEIKEAQAKGKGKGPIGYGQWPYKWWFDQVLVELAMLLGTDTTTPFLQKHKLYAQLGLQMGSDPVDSIVRWVRNQLYSNKLRWREMQLEALSPVLQELSERDLEFARALTCSRAVYQQNAKAVRGFQAASAVESSLDLAGLPEASSLFLRSAALSSRVWLDVYFEDVGRHGAPLGSHLLADLRRITYLLLRRSSIYEHGIAGEMRGSIMGSHLDLEAVPDVGPALQDIQQWPFMQRWLVFRKILEHNILQIEATPPQQPPAAVASGEEHDAPRAPEPPPLATVESAVWKAYEAERNGTYEPPSEKGFLCGIFEYLLSLNTRPEQPLIREHEFDSLIAMVALSCDACLPGAPLAEARDHMAQRLGEVKLGLNQMVAVNLHHNSEVRLPVRATAVAAWFQSATRHLMDLARLLWLDSDDRDGDASDPLLFLPEPREIFSGSLWAALYAAGAYDHWELAVPQGESHYRWAGFFRQLSQLRQEVVNAPVFWRWKQQLVQGFRKGIVKWPSQQQLQAERKRDAQGTDELPIDEHREKILKHIETHRVTCIQGETGCGKSTRVPVYIMEEYLERKKKGELKEDEKFQVLCTQPRRIACISLANRVASCLKERMGDTIGYKISGDSNVRPGRTKLIYVTTGYLLQVLVNNPEQIRSYTHLVLDEVHERDVDSDLLSLVIKLQMSGYEFKLVIMSATLQGDLFTRYFSDKKIKTIFVGVKRFPVETVYVEQILDRYGGRYGGDFGFGERTRPEATRGYQGYFCNQAMRSIRDAERCFGTSGYDAEGFEEEEKKPVKGEFDDSDSNSEEDSEDDEPAQAAVAQAAPKRRRKEVQPNIIRGFDVLVYELVLRVAQPGEGVLVFLPGIGEISELQETLMPLESEEAQAQMAWEPGVQRPDCRFKIFALHSLIPKDEQEGAVFDAPPPDTAHVILASNIAESSLTIPKVRVVIDYGLRRQLVYDKRRHMSCLITTWVSQASAKQRMGRTGRVFEGVAIRLFTKQFFESYMDDFDPPEMQTAPLEKLYVNVKHLSSKLPEYQITPTERRRRTPKELLQFTCQPPPESSVECSIEVLNQLGALSDSTEYAELTVLGHLMMTVPLDTQLCRVVVFGALVGIPVEGVVLASASSVQDPFTLPSHLIIKDPREYAEALKRSFETRKFFDAGHCSEPLMLRNLFVHFLTEFRKMLVDRCSGRGGGGRREFGGRGGYLRAAQIVGGKFAVVPKRVVHLAMSVLDTAQRMRKFIPQGSECLKQIDGLLALLQAGDKWHGSAENAEAQLPKIEDLFCSSSWKLKTLLIMAFTPQFMTGSTKVQPPEQAPVQTNWKKKKAAPRKEKNKMEQLLDEIVEQGLDPIRTVACVLEMPRGKGAVTRWHPRFMEDLQATIEMVTCGAKASLMMPADNRVLITFDKAEDKGAFEGVVKSADRMSATFMLDEEEGLVEDLPTPAHFIDLYGAGRWKFTVPMLNSFKIAQEKKQKEERERKEKEDKAEKEAKKKNAKNKGKDKDAEKVNGNTVEASKEVKPEPKQDEEKKEAGESKAEDTDAVKAVAAVPEAAEAKPEAQPADAENATDKETTAEAEAATPGDQEKSAEASAEATECVEASTTAPMPQPTEASPEAPAPQDQEPVAGEAEAAPTMELQEVDAEEPDEEAEEAKPVAVEDEQELGPPIGIYKPVTPYEINWEVIEQNPVEPMTLKKSVKGVTKVKKKVIKGRCSWRNPVGFLGSCNTGATGTLEPWPNKVFAVFTTLQGGDSKELSWVDGVTLISAEADGLLAFFMMVSFLRRHQELSFDVDLQDGRIFEVRGPGGLEFRPREDQYLLVEDILHINKVRAALSEAFYPGAPPVPVTVEQEEGIDFTGTRGRRDAEPVPQIAATTTVPEALDGLMQVLRDVERREVTMDERTWNERYILRKSTPVSFDMHSLIPGTEPTPSAPSSGASALPEAEGANGKADASSKFQLFSPYSDLAQAKRNAERAQYEEEERRRRAEEEKRQRKEDERRRKELDKRHRKEEEMRQKLEAQKLKLLGKKGKGAKGKGGEILAQGSADRYLDAGGCVGKNAKGKGKAAKEQPPRQAAQVTGKKEKQQQQGKGGKKGREEAVAQPSAGGGLCGGPSPMMGGPFGMPSLPSLPPPWVAVPDPNTGKFYYWNQATNEVTWIPPTASQSPQGANAGSAQAAMMQMYGAGWPGMYNFGQQGGGNGGDASWQ